MASSFVAKLARLGIQEKRQLSQPDTVVFITIDCQNFGRQHTQFSFDHLTDQIMTIFVNCKAEASCQGEGVLTC